MVSKYEVSSTAVTLAEAHARVLDNAASGLMSASAARCEDLRKHAGMMNHHG
jgi:hypothetical protein